MLFDNWFDSIEGGVRERVRGFIETMLEEELDGALCRPRYGRHKANGNEKAATLLVGCRHGHRKRALTGTFGVGYGNIVSIFPFVEALSLASLSSRWC
jgi:hypothetical protein